MTDIDKILEDMEREMCWYPFADCLNKAEKKAKEPIGSDPMQYCKKHDIAMRKRYSETGA